MPVRAPHGVLNSGRQAHHLPPRELLRRAGHGAADEVDARVAHRTSSTRWRSAPWKDPPVDGHTTHALAQ
eukprot:4573292-Pyramimonas_sp.AAC.1